MGRVIRGLAGGGTLRVVAAETTDVVEVARSRHDLSPTATAALGRALTGAGLLAHLLLKGPRERLTLRIDGDGPLGGLMAEADLKGRLRGYVRQPRAEVPISPQGKLDVGRLVGRGTLQVMRTLPSGDLHDSTVPIVSGEIAEDLAHHLLKSEQIPSAVLLGVRVGTDHSVEAAGGVIVQVLPGAPEDAIAALEANLKAIPGFSGLLFEQGLEGALEAVLAGLDFSPLASDFSLEFACRCSREKALRAIRFFPESEREAMAREGGAEVRCHWCGAVYHLSPEEIVAPDPLEG